VVADESTNPHLPLRRSIATMRVLGIVALALGAMQALPLLFVFQWTPWTLVTFAVLAGGISHLVVASEMNRRKWWAVAASLALVTIEILFVCFCVLGLVLSVGAIDLVRGKQMAVVALLAILVIVIIILGRLMSDLFASFEAIRLDPPPIGPRGFEPIPLAQRVEPLDHETGHVS
jgi:hypothetical protein